MILLLKVNDMNNTREEILQIIKTKKIISNTEISKILNISTVATYKHIQKLILEEKITKIWNAGSTRYLIKENNDYKILFTEIQKNIIEIYENSENINIEELINSVFLSFTASGDWLNWMDSLIFAIQRENNNIKPDNELIIRRSTEIIISYIDEENKRRKNWFFDGTNSLQNNLKLYNEKCYIDKIFFGEINMLSWFGKLKTATELYYWKLLENKKLLENAIIPQIENIKKFCKKENIDWIIITPPTLKRSIQFGDVFRENFDLPIIEIKVEKNKNKFFKPQKELKWNDRFINARESIIIKDDNFIKNMKHILIIDDNFTTGATINIIWEKLNKINYKNKISSITITGNFYNWFNYTENEI